MPIEVRERTTREGFHNNSNLNNRLNLKKKKPKIKTKKKKITENYFFGTERNVWESCFV